MRGFKLAALLLVLGVLTACADQPERVAKTLDGPLDTVSTVTLYDTANAQPIDDIFDALMDIDKRMSAVSSDSEIAAINARTTEAVAVSRDVFDLIALSKATGEATGGAFDVTVRPVVELWGIGTEHARVPSDAEINAALSLVDFRAITLDDAQGTVRLNRPGMALDLGGIAKGYACDVAVDILRRQDVRYAIIDLGGNIYAYGSQPGGAPWRVGVKNPMPGESRYFCIVDVTDRAVVTSGIYERFFEQDGRLYHHIMDPATGRPVDNELVSVTILDASSTQADALSTACFVLGLEDGLSYLSGEPTAEGIFVTSDWKVYITPGLADSFRITDERFTLVPSP